MVAPSGVGDIVGVVAELPAEELGCVTKGAGAAQGLRRRRPVAFSSKGSNKLIGWVGMTMVCKA